MDTTAEPVITRVRAGTAVIELDRPRALNALDLTMVRLMTRALEEWREDDAVRAVVVRSTSPKAFCAGGDIRAVREAGMRGDDTAVRAYFSAEYGLDGLIARYPKPYIALIDGYAMGGGLGISVHGSARVVTERASLAMPETSIGFFPDIGASWFLPRLPGAVGWYLGLTGVRIQAADAVDCGLATHYVPAAELPALEAALTGEGPLADRGADPAEALDRFATPAPPSDLAGHREAIERCFTAPDLVEAYAPASPPRRRTASGRATRSPRWTGARPRASRSPSTCCATAWPRTASRSAWPASWNWPPGSRAAPTSMKGYARCWSTRTAVRPGHRPGSPLCETAVS